MIPRTGLINLAAFVLISALVITTYHPSLDNGFLFDDHANITHYEPLHVSEFSLQQFWSAGSQAVLPTRIIPSVTFAFDWWRGGGQAKAFIQTNMLLHAINGFLVFALLSLVASTRFDRRTAGIVALFVACAWLLHPIQAQAVTYIVQRMASMATLFTLLAVIAYIKGRLSNTSSSRTGWFIVVGLSALLGGLSKENAWILPGLLILAEYGVVRSDWIEWVSPLERKALICLPVIVLLLLLSLWFETGPLWEIFSVGYERRDFTMWERLLTQPRVIAFHLSQIVFPLPERFSLIHQFSTSQSLFNPVTTLFAWLAALLWIAGGMLCLLRRHIRPLGFFILWLPLTLAIESSVVPLEMIFEHRLYLPSLGIAGIVVFALCAVWQVGDWGRYAVSAVASGVVIILTYATASYIPVWKSEWQVYQRAVALYPQHVRARALYGHSLLDERRFDEALAEFKFVQKKKPDWPSLDKFIGRAHAELGDFAAAEQAFKRALVIQPNDVELLNNMAALSLQRRDLMAAERWLRRALLINPAHPLVRANWRNLELLRASASKQ